MAIKFNGKAQSIEHEIEILEKHLEDLKHRRGVSPIDRALWNKAVPNRIAQLKQKLVQTI